MGEKITHNRNLPITWMEVPKVQPLIEFMDCALVGRPKGRPPTPNCNILNINLLHQCDIFIFVTPHIMLVLVFMWDQLLHVSIKWLGPMKETSLFLVNHFHIGISKPTINYNDTSICLCSIYHEYFKIGFNDSILEHVPIDFCP